MPGPHLRRSSPTPGSPWLRGRLAWIMLGMGIVAAAAAGLAWRSGQSTQAERSFRAEAISVGSTVTTAIRRMDDLTIATRTLLTSNPTLTNRQLGQWYQDAGVQGRYPGTLGFGFVQFVVEDQLPAYVAAVRADPVPAMKPIGDSLRLPPPGAAGGYCLIRLAVSHGLASLVPGGVTYDLCNVPGVGALLDPASASMSAISATMAPWGQILVVSVPVYRGHGTPTGAENRRARLRGWITGVFNVSAVLGSAVAGDSRLYVGVARQNPPSAVATYLHSTTSRLIDVASIGRKPDGARFTREFTLLADGAWTVTVSRPSGWGWLSPNDQGIAVFAGGTGATLLLFVLLQALTSGRARALRMVAEKTDELRHQALHDSLTGLPNRALLIDRTEQLLARSRREWIQPAAMFLDLDDFKSINDTFGHPVGDELLQAVGARISAALREPDTVGRLGGDEFLILLEGEPYSGGPELVAERLLNVLREPFQLTSLGAGSDPVEIGASIGIAVGARPHAEDLLRDADIALYEAKGDGKHRYSVFRAEMQAQLQGRRELEVDLQHALERDEFFLEYQPTFDLADDRLVCVEALVRWRHPRRGIIPPAEFIPMAESSGLIIPLGAWVLARACGEVQGWRTNGYAVDLSVNVSGLQLDDPRFRDTVEHTLETCGLDPHALILEITESVLMRNPDTVVRELLELKRIGIRIAIDDFGTGYSSLAYLQKFPVDELKIDRTFIERIAASDDSRALVHTLVQLGRTLKLATVAEGVEEAAQLVQLRKEECDYAQGFLFARPLAAADTEALLARVSAAPAA